MSLEMKAVSQDKNPDVVPAVVPRKLKIRKPRENQETGIIKSIIDTETKIETQTKEIQDKMNRTEKDILEHLGQYIEEPYQIIESYFEGKHLDRLVRHQIESYNNFVNYQIQRTIDMFNPVKIHSENDYVEEKQMYMLECSIQFNNFKL